MANITITIPDAVAQRALDGFCGYYDYQDSIDGIPNPETKIQFVKRILIEYIKSAVIDYEKRVAVHTAEVQATTDFETKVTIT